MTAPEPIARRAVLKTALAGFAATALGPTLVLIEARSASGAPGQAASSARRWGILIDVSRCQAGCSDCVEACSQEHGWPREERGAHEPQWIRAVTATDPTTGRASQLPLFCQHCANPPCADVCPTSATFRRADGIVLVDKHICIGCRYCVMACPFGVRFFQGDPVLSPRAQSPRGKGTAEGCNLCVGRIDRGQLPACVEACGSNHGAMTFGDLEDANSPIRLALAERPATRMRADLALDQSVTYQDL